MSLAEGSARAGPVALGPVVGQPTVVECVAQKCLPPRGPESRHRREGLAERGAASGHVPVTYLPPLSPPPEATTVSHSATGWGPGL